METDMTDMTVAKTILEQLGGPRFLAMTGARNLTGDANSLTMKLSMIRRHVKITLNPSDTYTVSVLRTRREHGMPFIIETKSESDVCNDALQATFTRMTGLHTHL
jgi:hypothetical protein